MAMLYYATDSVGPGNRAIVSGPDSVTIGPQASLVSTDGFNAAVRGSGQSFAQSVIVHGYVSGGTAISWTLGYYTQVVVGPTGIVESPSAAAIYLAGTYMSITNNGVISGSVGGAELYSDHGLVINYGLICTTRSLPGATALALNSPTNALGSEAEVINYGKLVSAYTAFYGDSDFGDRLRNYGVIEGDCVHYAGDDILLNRGTISGDVNMGSDNDSIDNRMGLIDGDVDLGLGDDTLDTRGGTILGQVLGGDGLDRFILGSGAEDDILGGAGLDIIQFAAGAGAIFALDGSFANAG